MVVVKSDAGNQAYTRCYLQRKLQMVSQRPKQVLHQTKTDKDHYNKTLKTILINLLIFQKTKNNTEQINNELNRQLCWKVQKFNKKLLSI